MDFRYEDYHPKHMGIPLKQRKWIGLCFCEAKKPQEPIPRNIAFLLLLALFNQLAKESSIQKEAKGIPQHKGQLFGLSLDVAN